MKLLLLSRSTGALAPFLATHGRATTRRIGYVDDAQVAFADAPFVRAERTAVEALGFEVVPITVREVDPVDLDATLSTLDGLYVASGSTFALLEALRISGNDAVLVRHVRAGLPYVGASAGSIIAGPDVTPASSMDDPSDGPSLDGFAGLCLIDRTVIPHADGRVPPYPPELIAEILATYGTSHALLPLHDDQALLVEDDAELVIPSPD